jgi:hypothetical protein
VSGFALDMGGARGVEERNVLAVAVQLMRNHGRACRVIYRRRGSSGECQRHGERIVKVAKCRPIFVYESVTPSWRACVRFDPLSEDQESRWSVYTVVES